MATTTKTKKKVYTNVTIEQAQAAGQTFATNTNRLAAIEALISKKVTELRTTYQTEINELTAGLEEPKKVLETYAQENKSKWEKKSFDLLHCVLSFRLGNREVDKTSTFTWAGVIQVLKNFKNLKQFVRTKEEVDKKAILALTDEKILKQLQDKCGITIKQDESFYIAAKTEEVIA